jgi:hypothetical protein
MGASLARGLATVGSSLPLLVTSFLATLGFWLIYSSYGRTPSPAAMVLLESLPPVHSLLDLELVLSPRVVVFPLAVAYLAGLLVLRVALQSLWIGLMLEWLAGNRGWRSSLRPAMLRGLRGFAPMVTVEATFTLLIVSSVFVVPGVLGPSLGQIAFISALVGGVYFLILAPVIAVAEAQPLRPTLRLAVRAARIPGRRHVLMSLSYIALALFVFRLTPGSEVAAATPSITTWAFTMFVSFIHLAFLGAFTFRWLVVRGPVISSVGAPAAARPSARSRQARR